LVTAGLLDARDNIGKYGRLRVTIFTIRNLLDVYILNGPKEVDILRRRKYLKNSRESGGFLIFFFKDAINVVGKIFFKKRYLSNYRANL
jgi:hypothetical protein